MKRLGQVEAALRYADKEIEFKLFVNKKSYIKVYVWPTQKIFREKNFNRAKRFGYSRPLKNVFASHLPVKAFRRQPKKKRALPIFLGEIHFYRSYVTVGCVAHELYHVALNYVRFYKKYHKIMEDYRYCWREEEKIAKTFERMTNKFWKNYCDRSGEAAAKVYNP